jgi:hypothetical protein
MLFSANYFDVLGVKAAFGRTFSRYEDREEGLTWEMSRRLIGGGAGAIHVIWKNLLV